MEFSLHCCWTQSFWWSCWGMAPVVTSQNSRWFWRCLFTFEEINSPVIDPYRLFLLKWVVWGFLLFHTGTEDGFIIPRSASLQWFSLGVPMTGWCLSSWLHYQTPSHLVSQDIVSLWFWISCITFSFWFTDYVLNMNLCSLILISAAVCNSSSEENYESTEKREEIYNSRSFQDSFSRRWNADHIICWVGFFEQ